MSSYELTRIADATKAAINPATLEKQDEIIALFPQDVLESVPRVIENEHAEIHAGNSYKAINQQLSLGTGTVKYGITVGASFPHMLFEVSVYNGTVQVNVYAEATFTSGSAMAVKNRNRNSTKTAVATATSGVTSTDGTLIESFFVGSGGKSGDIARSAAEWVLKMETIYRVDLIGLVAGTEAVMAFDWYE